MLRDLQIQKSSLYRFPSIVFQKLEDFTHSTSAEFLKKISGIVAKSQASQANNLSMISVDSSEYL